jgi:hypothetical protein
VTGRHDAGPLILPPAPADASVTEPGTPGVKGTTMRTMAALVVAGLATVIGAQTGRTVPPAAPLQLADMGMGDLGPQLGGSDDDMVVDDPGHLPPQADMEVDDPGYVPKEADMQVDDPGHEPREADMFVDDPGHLPPQAEMDIQPQRDLDLQDDISE